MGGGQQMKSSTSSSSTSSPLAPFLAQEAQQQFKTFQPLQGELVNQMLEGLRTGGVTSQIPLINRALDATRAAGSKSVEDVRQNVARSGLGGSSEGEAQIGEAQQQAEETAAKTPQDIIMSFLQGAPGFALGGTSSALTAFARAMAANQTSRGEGTPSFWDTFNQTLTAGADVGAAFA